MQLWGPLLCTFAALGQRRQPWEEVEVAAKEYNGKKGTHAFVLEQMKLWADSDEEAIRRLVSASGCLSVYFDVGTNIGVQIRKVFEPHLYPKAPILRHFTKWLGAQDTLRRLCGVCVFGFEPNPRHRPRNTELQKRYLEAGAAVHMFEAAASIVDGQASFTVSATAPGDTTDSNLDWGGNTVGHVRKDKDDKTRITPTENLTVRTLDLARIMSVVREAVDKEAKQQNTSRGSVVMKMDIEGMEYAVLPHMVRSRILCEYIDFMYLEWHWRHYIPPHIIHPVLLIKHMKWIHEMFKEKKDCHTEVSNLDDETYFRDENRAWPKPGGICKRGRQMKEVRPGPP
eukprot:Hpha_TRINITY_DN779_c0_g1::TRINITY_DN779_c0_g1_i1::g.28891::m.28891